MFLYPYFIDTVPLFIHLFLFVMLTFIYSTLRKHIGFRSNPYNVEIVDTAGSDEYSKLSRNATMGKYLWYSIVLFNHGISLYFLIYYIFGFYSMIW